MKKYLKIALLVVVAAIFIWTFVFLWQKSRPETTSYEILAPEVTDMEKTTVISGVKGAARPAGAEPPAPGRAAGAQPPAGSRARRDYFEEFFRSNGNRREAPKGGDGGRDSEKQ